jgi:hypothetical protein
LMNSTFLKGIVPGGLTLSFFWIPGFKKQYRCQHKKKAFSIQKKLTMGPRNN